MAALNPIKKESLIEKRNVLNEMRANNMTLQELRFFSIYLSKINARDIKTRLVRFALTDFQRIMELPRIQANDIKPVVNKLLGRVVNIPTERGGFIAFQLFKECKVDKDNDGVWFVEIDAHDKALPLMFEFKNRYFTYQLWNALRLKSANQLRMYEILKQYEYLGERTISLSELRSFLGIEPTEYPRWERFRTRVLDGCQKALEETTDIKFTYEPIRKGRKGIVEVKFIIKKNNDYIDQLTLDEFIDMQPEPDYADDERELQYDEHLRLLAEACNYEFTNKEMQVLFNEIRLISDIAERYHFLKDIYDKMNLYAGVDKRYAYMRKIVEAEMVKRVG